MLAVVHLERLQGLRAYGKHEGIWAASGGHSYEALDEAS